MGVLCAAASMPAPLRPDGGLRRCSGEAAWAPRGSLVVLLVPGHHVLSPWLCCGGCQPGLQLHGYAVMLFLLTPELRGVFLREITLPTPLQKGREAEWEEGDRADTGKTQSDLETEGFFPSLTHMGPAFSQDAPVSS